MRKIVMQSTKKKGQGVFAKQNITKGEVVHEGKPVMLVKERTSHSFQIQFKAHVQLDKTSRTINHSCEPNTGVQYNIYAGYEFVALRDIKKGEEITWDYETTEYISISVSKCLCGSPLCRKKLKGFKYLSTDVISRYGKYIADYLK